jgi:hypothetical protein
VRSYLDSERGRGYIRSQLRRSQVVEELVDRWIADHLTYERVQHQHPRHTHDERGPASPVDEVIADESDDTDEINDELAAIEAAAAEGAAR